MSETGPNRRPVETEDLYRYRLLSDPQVSPDGLTAAYVLTRLRKKKNDYASNIWLVPTDGSGAPRQFTAGPHRDMLPRWSPDGRRLAFVSTRSGKPQIWTIPVDGGEAIQLTRSKRGLADFGWSPDGRWIIFSATVDNDADRRIEAENIAKAVQKAQAGEEDTEGGDSLNRDPGAGGSEDLPGLVLPAGYWPEDEDEEKQHEEKGDHAKVFTRLPYKADGEGLVERRAHLFVISATGGKARQITEGEWDAASPRWSPDGTRLAYLSNKEPDEGQANINDVFVADIDEHGVLSEAQRITNHDRAIMALDWLPSSDGFIVFGHMRVMEGGLATNPQVWRLGLDGQFATLSEGFDRPVGPWISSDLRAGTGELRSHFSPDGRIAYFPVTDEGCVHIYSVPIGGGEVRLVIGGERQVLNFTVSPIGLVFAATSTTMPNDLFASDLGGSNERRLTGVNDDVMSLLQVSQPREFWLDRPDGGRVQGWVLLPPDYQEGRKYPLVLQIHGGPHMSFGNVYFHEFQLMAGRGFIVLYTNPRGSQGYGQAFSDAILNDWGGIDYEDIMACLEYAIAQGNVDEDRLGVAGGSYGGYMVTWAIGHTRRFRAAVASRMVSNLYSCWGAGDFTWMLLNWEFEGSPRERTALYLERSPISHVEKIETPLLITHALDDQRTSIEQGEQMYTALQRLGRKVKMVLFPSGGHDISRSGKPSLRVERLDSILSWFEEYLT